MNALLFFTGAILFALLLAQKQRWLATSLLLTLAISGLLYHDAICTQLATLGTDSMHEAGNFTWEEARFYLQTIQLDADARHLPAALLITILLVPITRLPTFFAASLATACLMIPLYHCLKAPLMLMQERPGTALATQPMAMPALDDRPVKLVVYMGESTSAMHMSLYGYPRATTPLLERLRETDRNLLVFDHVFSTHTHTSQSLREAFAIATHPEEDAFLPIDQRRHVPLAEWLATQNIPTYLLSNQVSSGASYDAVSHLFNHAIQNYSTPPETAKADPRSHTKQWDHAFFGEHLSDAMSALADNPKGLLVMHAYAGHGTYLLHLPQAFRGPVDQQFADRNPNAILGADGTPELITQLDAYDSAIRYIDFAVSETITALKVLPAPVIFVYTADHGEAPMTGRGHDSSRFVHEMARVPLLVYFNDAARKAYPERFTRYQAMAQHRPVMTLAALPDMLLELLGGQNIPMPPAPAPILVRQTGEGSQYVQLGNLPSAPEESFDRTDLATRIATLTAAHTSPPILCYHRANSYAKAVRGAFVAECIESDVVMGEDGTAMIAHPPAEASGFTLEEVLAIAKPRERAVWIDGKNLNEPAHCTALLKQLKEIPPAAALVEFPSGSAGQLEALQDCTHAMQEVGLATSYYVPTAQAMACAEEQTPEACQTLQTTLQQVQKSGNFTDISFDYRGIEAIERLPEAKYFKWNTWRIDPQNLSAIQPERFRMIILRNADPNAD